MHMCSSSIISSGPKLDRDNLLYRSVSLRDSRMVIERARDRDRDLQCINVTTTKFRYLYSESTLYCRRRMCCCCCCCFNCCLICQWLYLNTWVPGLWCREASSRNGRRRSVWCTWSRPICVVHLQPENSKRRRRTETFFCQVFFFVSFCYSMMLLTFRWWVCFDWSSLKCVVFW